MKPVSLAVQDGAYFVLTECGRIYQYTYLSPGQYEWQERTRFELSPPKPRGRPRKDEKNGAPEKGS